MLKIAVTGTTGRMGKEIIAVIDNEVEIILTEALVRKGSKLLNVQVNQFIKLNGISDNLFFTDCLNNDKVSDVVIDFSLPIATCNYIKQCLELSKPIVIGTTGFNTDEKEVLQEAATKIPLLCAPNMSLGVNICYNLLASCAKCINSNWQVAINEFHHKHKKDAPSGTAVKMREVIAKSGDIDENSIQTNSVRAGDLIGEHNIFFIGDGESIEITHKATNREAFAKGAVIAAKWLVNQKPGFYTMQDVIYSLSFS